MQPDTELPENGSPDNESPDLAASDLAASDLAVPDAVFDTPTDVHADADDPFAPPAPVGAIQRIKDNREIIMLAAVLLVAAILRFTGVNWDSGGHLHPDERYMTLVAVEVNWPGSFDNYLDVTTSTLSPYNTENYKAYVYGTFPLFVTKAVADFRGMGEYGQLNLVGRQLSAVFDLGNLVLVYLVGNRLFRRRRSESDAMAAANPELTSNQREFRQLGLYSAALYAFTVFAIQQSHFFTVDNYESFFIFLSFFFLVRFFNDPTPVGMVKNIFFASLAVGFGIASKLSALLFLPVIALALAFKLLRDMRSQSFWRNALLYEALGILSLLTAYVTVRIFNPYMFATNSWTDITFNESFQAALDQQRSAIKGEFMFPPQWQWVPTQAYWFPLKNYLIWGLGLPMGIVVMLGLARYAISLRPSAQVDETAKATNESRDRFWWAAPATLALVWILGLFLYRAGNYVKTMRYFLYLVPFVVIFATYALSELRRYRQKLFVPTAALVLGLTAIWAIGFTSIYRNPSTRIAASNWIFENIPSEAVLANEHWDDGLPVWFDAEEVVYYNDRVELEVYGYDQVTSEKVQRLYDKLSRTDYIFVSSTRASGSIGKLPESHPFAVSYYQNLADGSLGFELEKKITSYPSFLGIELSDESAEEAFWVYDHPTVRIYKKAFDLTYEEFYATINDDAELVSAEVAARNSG